MEKIENKNQAEVKCKKSKLRTERRKAGKFCLQGKETVKKKRQGRMKKEEKEIGRRRSKKKKREEDI